MTTQSTHSATTGFSITYTVQQSPAEVFAAILDLDAWWTGDIDGTSDELGAEFDYRHPPQHYSRQRVVALEKDQRVAWRVVDSNLPFAADPHEWTGTEIVFELAPSGSGTELRFTHVGLVPEVDCFDACSNGWLHYVNGSLHSLITTGAGLPEPW